MNTQESSDRKILRSMAKQGSYYGLVVLGAILLAPLIVSSLLSDRSIVAVARDFGLNLYIFSLALYAALASYQFTTLAREIIKLQKRITELEERT